MWIPSSVAHIFLTIVIKNWRGIEKHTRCAGEVDSEHTHIIRIESSFMAVSFISTDGTHLI